MSKHSEVAAGGEGVGVVGSEDAGLVIEQWGLPRAEVTS